MRLYFLTLFPEIIHGYFNESMMKRALENGVITYEAIDIRDFAENKHNRVDDYPYGGGAGMVMAAPSIIRALRSIPDYESYPFICTSPGGKTFSGGDAVEMAAVEGLIFLCGHYEGIDQRVIDAYVTQEYSIGDYVLTGGELPALVMADAIARHVPGFMGNTESLSEESFENGRLEYPQYTRPESFEDLQVPSVLLSGNHGAIRQWREEQSLLKTKKNRPDLLEKEDAK
ncbi:MAG: tRNA (guanosine(37)-N1)-methyltransferase TrmD [Eubacterium aggregans]|uniref:tRNA (guanosine(37)-N1)-methyltransferase TrmD n=1 Tax=Eubacterium aggregans TaxID=81409 RepID=UPI002B205914|nr:tRNA (guanosine(37)-N1)-methyltransferase TrmD [Eubacterium aggregans]MEA5072739.1 tRNA (guanosine(37)-N1)-methyltransferase TrmD [Eubacterium aggregans]